MHKDSFMDRWSNQDTELAQFGVHLMIDGYDGSATKLADQAYIRNLLNTLPDQLGMHKIANPVVVEVGPQNQKDPGGLSGIVLIAESHISLHTFPLRGFISADVYTCQNQLDAEAIVSRFQAAFALKAVDQQQVKRGLRYPNRNVHPAVAYSSDSGNKQLEDSHAG
jgi:S-adenosylmethionine decarboxylase